MNRRQFIPMLAVVPLVVKQLVANKPTDELSVAELSGNYTVTVMAGHTITVISHDEALSNSDTTVGVQGIIPDAKTYKCRRTLITGKVNVPIVLSEPMIIESVSLYNLSSDTFTWTYRYHYLIDCHKTQYIIERC